MSAQFSRYWMRGKSFSPRMLRSTIAVRRLGSVFTALTSTPSQASCHLR